MKLSDEQETFLRGLPHQYFETVRTEDYRAANAAKLRHDGLISVRSKTAYKGYVRVRKTSAGRAALKETD